MLLGQSLRTQYLPTNDPDLATDGDDVLVGTGEPLAGFGGDDILVAGPAADFEPFFGDYASFGVFSQSDVPEFGNDTLIGSEASSSLHGDGREVAVVPDDGEDVILSLGDDKFYSYTATTGTTEQKFGDVSQLAIIVDGEVGGTVEVYTGDDIFFNDSTVEIYGDSRTIDIIQTTESGSIYVELGNDTIFGGLEQYGDALGLLISGTETDKVTVECGDDFLNAKSLNVTSLSSTEMYGDFVFIDMHRTDGGTGTVICGNDTLVGFDTDDKMVGDYEPDYFSDFDPTWNIIAGADRFVFEGEFGNDYIYDFNVGLDSLHFLSFDGFGIDDIAMSHDATNDELLLDLTAIGGGTVTLLGVEEIAEGDIVFA